jgi:hypothetical protein
MLKEIFIMKKKKSVFLCVLKKCNFKNMVLFFFLFVSLSGFSQQNIQISERNEFLITLTNGNSKSVYNKIVDLMDGVQSSIYLNDNLVKTYGKIPVCLYSDVASLVSVANLNLDVSTIEMVTIKINKPSELSSTLDFTTFSKYKNLKYIYIRLNFDFDLTQLIKQIKIGDVAPILIYSLDKGA